MSWQDPMFVVKKECDLSSQFFVSRDTERVGKVMIRGLATLESGGVFDRPSHTQPCPEPGARQGRRGKKDHDV